jgi:hypothetical protein
MPSAEQRNGDELLRSGSDSYTGCRQQDILPHYLGKAPAVGSADDPD